MEKDYINIFKFILIYNFPTTNKLWQRQSFPGPRINLAKLQKARSNLQVPTVFGSTPSISNGPIIRNQYSNSHHHGVPHSASAGTELQSQHLMRPTEIELEEDEM